MDKKKPMDYVETFGDFWLGMAGAVAGGFSAMTKQRRERKDVEKAKKPDDESLEKRADDFFLDVTTGMKAAITEAQQVVEQTKRSIAGEPFSTDLSESSSGIPQEVPPEKTHEKSAGKKSA